MMTLAKGRVVAIRPQAIEAHLPGVRLGDVVRITTQGASLLARVTATRKSEVLLTPLGDARGLAPGDPVESRPLVRDVPGPAGLGHALDPSTECRTDPRRFEHVAITEPLWTGIRAIDGLATFGRGARIGIFGPPGSGKSTLLTRLASEISADVVVIGLIGERGREAERWMRVLDARTTIVCATSDRSAAERVRAAELAFAHAEALRRRGLDVALIIDSLARVAASARELALGLGEPLGRGGYPPSVFSELAKLIERAGGARGGSITLVATVLSEDGGLDDPLAEAVRSLIDGHLILDRDLAQAARFPAIEIVNSVSRTMDDVVSASHRRAAAKVRAALARLRESADLRAAGLLVPGQDTELDRAVAALPRLESFLYGEGHPQPPELLDELVALADSL